MECQRLRCGKTGIEKQSLTTRSHCVSKTEQSNLISYPEAQENPELPRSGLLEQSDAFKPDLHGFPGG
jgi:hypothetical protein